MQFLDPENTGKFSSKHFVELASHYNLIATYRDYKINLLLILYCIYEAVEQALNQSKSLLSSHLLSEHNKNSTSKDDLYTYQYLSNKLVQVCGVTNPKIHQKAF